MKINNNIAAVKDILNHDRQIGEILDSAHDLKVSISKVDSKDVENTQNRVYGGIQSKEEYRMMKSAQREEEDWSYFAQRYGLDLMPVVHKPTEFREAESDKPKAKIIRKPIKSGSYHGSYVKATQHHIETEKKMLNQLKLEDELDIKPIDNPFAGDDEMQLIKVIRYEYRDPYIIVVAQKVEDEHKRLTQTRSLDEISEIYYTFDVRKVKNEKGEKVQNPDLDILTNWLISKVSKDAKSFFDALEEVTDRVYLTSTVRFIPKVDRKGNPIMYRDKEGNMKPSIQPNPDFIGYPTYSVDELADEWFDKKARDYVGNKTNIYISKRQISNDNGDLRIIRNSDSIDVFYGEKLERTYKIAE